MKKAIILLLSLVAMEAAGQNVQQTPDGNFKALPRQEQELKPTGQTFTDNDGKVYPVYTTSRGSLFVIRTSKKTGKEYRYYLQTEAKKEEAK